MKWLLLLVLSVPCFAQPTLQGNCGNGATAGTTTSCTLGGAVVAGQHIFAFVSGNSSMTFSTPTMTGETFTPIAGAVVSAAPSAIKGYEVISAVGGQTVVNASEAGCSGCGFHLNVIVTSASTIDKTGTLSNSTATPWTITSGSTTTANELVAGFYYDDSSNATYVAGAGYAITNQSPLSNGNSAAAETKTVSSTGAQTATITGPANGVDSVSGVILTLQTPAVGPNVGFKGLVGRTGKTGIK